jgi:hypothetical protein
MHTRIQHDMSVAAARGTAVRCGARRTMRNMGVLARMVVTSYVSMCWMTSLMASMPSCTACVCVRVCVCVCVCVRACVCVCARVCV